MNTKKLRLPRTAFQNLLAFLDSFKRIDDHTFRNALDSEMEFAEFSTPTIIQPEHKVANKAFFISKGMAYAYYSDENGNKIPFRIFQKGEIALLADSFFNKRRAKTGLMACGDTAALSIESISLKQIFSKHPGASMLAANILSSIMDKDRLRNILLNLKGIDRIREFYNQFPMLENENKLQFFDKQIAAYLHMTSVSFSRLKAELQIEMV
ncbi:Crp/Fnr family transcriptional regulator [Pedobacter sp. P26]|uniref:Crp/Fnr family transcriptional regulator n=1 Tax=Pedobacter sp. P26 TaxID=3423956 RepID=UPI003D671259